MLQGSNHWTIEKAEPIKTCFTGPYLFSLKNPISILSDIYGRSNTTQRCKRVDRLTITATAVR